MEKAKVKYPSVKTPIHPWVEIVHVLGEFISPIIENRSTASKKQSQGIELETISIK